MTAFDRTTALRGLGYSLLICALTFGVMLLTDEPGSTLPQRIARLGAFMPALAALGSGLALAQVKARGEARALGALGASPFRVALGPSVVAWALGMVAVALLASPAVDMSALFPLLSPDAGFVAESGAFVNAQRGVSIDALGTLHFREPAAEAAPVAPAGAREALLATAPLVIALPVWVSAPLAAGWRALGGFAALAVLLVLMHATASGSVAGAWLAVASLPLLVQACSAHWGPA